MSMSSRIRWTPLRTLASLVILGGVWGVISTVLGLPEFLSGGLVSNPAYVSDLRLPPSEAVQELRSAYAVNFATVFLSTIPFVLMAVLLLSIVRDLYRIAALRALIAGLFLSASVVSGLLLGITVLKVSEFAFQSTILTTDEQRWLEGGVTFLNQLHLVFVDGWFFFAGIGWIFLGLAALSCRNWGRAIGFVTLAAGVMVVGGVVLSYWLPVYGEMAPSFVGLLADKLNSGGMALGLLTSGLLAWSLSTYTSMAAGRDTRQKVE